MHIPRDRFVCGTRRAERLLPAWPLFRVSSPLSLSLSLSLSLFSLPLVPLSFLPSLPLSPPLVCMFDVQLIPKEWVIAHALVTVCARMLEWTATRPVCPRRIRSRTVTLQLHVLPSEIRLARNVAPFSSSFRPDSSLDRFDDDPCTLHLRTNHERNVLSTIDARHSATRKLKPPGVRPKEKGLANVDNLLEHRRRTASLLLNHRIGECNRTKIGARTWQVSPVPLDRRQRVSSAYQSKCAST